MSKRGGNHIGLIGEQYVRMLRVISKTLINVQHVPSITESSNSVETSQCTSNSLVENEKPCDQVFDNNSIVQELNNDISSHSDHDGKDRSINHSLNGIY